MNEGVIAHLSLKAKPAHNFISGHVFVLKKKTFAVRIMYTVLHLIVHKTANERPGGMIAYG